MPSAPALEINITFILCPSLLLSFVTPFTSKSLLGERPLSPVIMVYRAGIKSLRSDAGFIVLASTISVGLVLNSDFALSPYRVNPISSKANAMGIKPASIYCE